jgi:hypothetical protein
MIDVYEGVAVTLPKDIRSQSQNGVSIEVGKNS